MIDNEIGVFVEQIITQLCGLSTSLGVGDTYQFDLYLPLTNIH